MSLPRRAAVAGLSAVLAAALVAARPGEGPRHPPVEPPSAIAAAGHGHLEREPFGKMPDGRAVEIYHLTDPRGVTVSVITYGAILTRVRAPDRAGHFGDILLGYDHLERYLKDNGPHFGSLVGRVSNRIARGTFTLDGRAYHLPINNGPNTLHGGNEGYDRRLWTAEPVEVPDGTAVRLSLVDRDGQEGFPGTVHAAVTYTLTDRGGLRITYEATTDRATPISLTSHGYWNLKDGGRSSVLDEEMRLHADRYLPVDRVQIPTGELAPVAGTPFDFRQFKPIGRDLAMTPEADKHRGFDHTMVIDGPPGAMRPAGIVYDPSSGRVLRMLTTEPGVQFYTGNFLDGSLTGRDGAVYKQNHAFALEAQAFPDAVNHPSFPPCILHPGEVYRQATQYEFDTADRRPD